MVGLLLVFFTLLLGLGLGLGLGLASLLFHVFTKINGPNNLPNGSMGWPLLGETLGFLKPHRSNSMGTFLQEHISRYGRVFKSHVFGSPTIVSCDNELNMFILQNEEKLVQASYPKPMHGILGKFSLIVVHRDLHQKLRKIAISFITTSKSSPDFLLCVEKLSISMIESWKGRNEIGFCKEVKKFTLDLMVKHLLSIEPEEPTAAEILEDFLTYMRGFVSLPIPIPGTPYTNAVKARKRMSFRVRKTIKERELKDDDAIKPRKRDFLDVVMSKEGLSDEERVSIVLDLLLGGYETTATLLALTIFFLGQAPNLLDKLKEEHQAIREKKEEGGPLNWKDYQRMEFTKNVICEALRCGNVVKFVHRQALQEVKFKDYTIPRGWKVLPIFTAAHFDPSLHENPSEFNPLRWTDKTMSKKVLAFGGGPRLCPGADLAKVEIAFFLHHLVLNYRLRLQEDEMPIAYPYVEFKRGLLLQIEPTGESILRKEKEYK